MFNRRFNVVAPNRKAILVNKCLMILIFAFVSTNAVAEWTLVQTSDDGNMYIDFDSIQKSGDLVTVTTLNDYYNVQAKSELSSQFKELHDCRSKKFKALSIGYYSEPMAKGRTIATVELNEAETAWSTWLSTA